jgi:hypothetical protein
VERRRGAGFRPKDVQLGQNFAIILYPMFEAETDARRRPYCLSGATQEARSSDWLRIPAAGASIVAADKNAAVASSSADAVGMRIVLSYLVGGMATLTEAIASPSAPRTDRVSQPVFPPTKPCRAYRAPRPPVP